MKKVVVSILVAAGGLLAAVSCGDDPSPTAPSPVPAPGAPPAAAGGGRAALLQPAAHGDVRGLQPGSGGDASSFNAYDFEVSWDGSMLHLALIEDEMRSMREASKPHRNRRITVGTCPVEPHHALQSCGDPIWSGTRVLAGRLELPPIPLASCAGWLVVSAAELSDDRYDGWRNAPCPNPDGGTVGSDGSGETWSEDPGTRTPDRVQRTVNEAVSAAGGLTPGGDPVSVAEVGALFEETEGTTGDDFRGASSAPTVATVVITDNPHVEITPVGAGRTTIEVVFLRSGASIEFDVDVEPVPHLWIVDPGDKRYRRGETITPFSFDVRGPRGSEAVTVEVTVTVRGLPPGLRWSEGRVSGTVTADARPGGYEVLVTATAGGRPRDHERVFTIYVARPGPPTWILLADSLTQRRRDMFSGVPSFQSPGPGPDPYGDTGFHGGSLRKRDPPIRWARWYYEEGSDPQWTIVQVYLGDCPRCKYHVGWSGPNGVGIDGCYVYGANWPGDSMTWYAYRAARGRVFTSGTKAGEGRAELLDSSAPVRFLDGAGNPIARVPAGYDDDPARLFTMRIRRYTHKDVIPLTLFQVACGMVPPPRGELWEHTVPAPPPAAVVPPGP